MTHSLYVQMVQIVIDRNKFTREFMDFFCFSDIVKACTVVWIAEQFTLFLYEQQSLGYCFPKRYALTIDREDFVNNIKEALRHLSVVRLSYVEMYLGEWMAIIQCVNDFDI